MVIPCKFLKFSSNKSDSSSNFSNFHQNKPIFMKYLILSNSIAPRRAGFRTIYGFQSFPRSLTLKSPTRSHRQLHFPIPHRQVLISAFGDFEQFRQRSGCNTIRENTVYLIIILHTKCKVKEEYKGVLL